jgi:hypothetical protein
MQIYATQCLHRTDVVEWLFLKLLGDIYLAVFPSTLPASRLHKAS